MTERYNLPTPASDDWEECSWDDILHTDERVKAEYISGTVIEGVPDGISDNGVYLVDGNLIQYSPDAKWSRIPAPVVHPDPDNNPVILVREVHGKTYDPPVVAIVRDSSTQNHPVYVYGDNGSAFPDYITDWSPAKVVADDE